MAVNGRCRWASIGQDGQRAGHDQRGRRHQTGHDATGRSAPPLDHQPAGGEQRQVGGQQVVRAAADQREQHQEHHPDHRERAERAGAPQPPQPGDPDRREQRVHREHLHGQVQERAGDPAHLVAHRACDGEHRPAVHRLPDEVRAREPDREQRRPPTATATAPTTAAPGVTATATTSPIASSASVFLFSSPTPATAPNASHQRGSAPVSSLTSTSRHPAHATWSNADGPYRWKSPSAIVEVLRGDRGDELRGAPAAQLPRDERREHGHRGPGQRRPQPQPDERLAEQLPREPPDRRGQRRLAGEPPGQPLGLGEEVHLVAVPPVAGGGGEVQQHGRRGHGEDRPRVPDAGGGRSCGEHVAHARSAAGPRTSLQRRAGDSSRG